MAGKTTSRLSVYARVRGRLHKMAGSTGINYKTLHSHLIKDKDSKDPDRFYVTYSTDDKAVVLKYYKMQPSQKVYYD